MIHLAKKSQWTQMKCLTDKWSNVQNNLQMLRFSFQKYTMNTNAVFDWQMACLCQNNLQMLNSIALIHLWIVCTFIEHQPMQ